MSLVENYGWMSETGPHSCEYLVPAVIAQLAKLKPASVLDLGSGNGALCRALVHRGYHVVGVEPDADGVAVARKAAPGIPFYQLAVGDSPSPLVSDYPQGFDVVVSTEVIEHLYLPRELPRFARSVLRPGGRLLLTTPYHGYLKNLALSAANKWDTHLDPLWDGGHIKFWSPRTLRELLHGEGFQVEAVHGVGRVPPLWKSMLVQAQAVRDE